MFATDPFNPPFRQQDATAEMIDNTFNGSFIANYAGKAFNFSSQRRINPIIAIMIARLMEIFHNRWCYGYQ
jgi:hypothetical protein